MPRGRPKRAHVTWNGQKLAQAIRDAGLEDKQVAAMVGVTPGMMSKWIGGMVPTEDQCIALAKALRLPSYTFVPPEWVRRSMGLLGDLLLEDSPVETVLSALGGIDKEQLISALASLDRISQTLFGHPMREATRRERLAVFDHLLERSAP